MYKKFVIRTSLLFCVLAINSIFLCGYANADSKVIDLLYKQKKNTEKVLRLEDEELLGDLMDVRHLLMSGIKKRSLAKIILVSDHLSEKFYTRRYRRVNLILLRIKEGRNPRYVYVLPSYEKVFGGNMLNPPLDKTLYSFKEAKRDKIKASLELNYIDIRIALGRAYKAALKGKLKDADGYMQDLYSDMIDDEVLVGDPLQHAKDQLRAASTLLNEGKTQKAVVLLNQSEQQLLAYIERDPDASHIGALQKAMRGYDKIRTYNYGQPDEISKVRIKMYNTVSSMRGKMKPLRIKLSL